MYYRVTTALTTTLVVSAVGIVDVVFGGAENSTHFSIRKFSFIDITHMIKAEEQSLG